MRLTILLATLALIAGVAAVAIAAGRDDADDEIDRLNPGQPRVEVLTPRNGSRHRNQSVVVRVGVENFRLAPERFGEQPLLGEGHIRFSLNRIPDCVDSETLEQTLDDPRGSGRITGASFDHPEYSGANGLLAESIGVAGSYSPATEPHILYANLNPGIYRLVVALARNDGRALPAHTATTFEILPPSGSLEREVECEPGEIPTQEVREELH